MTHPKPNSILTAAAAGMALALYLALVFLGLEILGWLGMGIVGAAALGISYRADLFHDHGNVHSDDVFRSVMLKPKFNNARASFSPIEKLKEQAARSRFRTWQAAANAVFTIVMVVGFGLFFWDIRAEFLL